MGEGERAGERARERERERERDRERDVPVIACQSAGSELNAPEANHEKADLGDVVHGGEQLGADPEKAEHYPYAS